tara:strand:- start:377 stop:625 length:249 start_codon:yes stop_codon:yes gene_type:complete
MFKNNKDLAVRVHDLLLNKLEKEGYLFSKDKINLTSLNFNNANLIIPLDEFKNSFLIQDVLEDCFKDIAKEDNTTRRIQNGQ